MIRLRTEQIFFDHLLERIQIKKSVELMTLNLQL